MAKVKIGNILNCIFNRGALSTIWSSTVAYTEGQYVAYKNDFYKCIKNASAGTVPTNKTYWAKTDLASEITSLNSNLATIVSPKLLYSGSFSSGTITVKGISAYTMIALIVDDYYMCVGTQRFGIGGYVPFSTTNINEYGYGFLYNSVLETLTIDQTHPGVVYTGGNKTAVQKIYGIF